MRWASLAAFLASLTFPVGVARSQGFVELRRMLPPALDTTWDVALGDVDGDGDLDLWIGTVGEFPGDQDRLLLNDGTGVFRDATASLPTLLDVTAAVALGDVDGDGDLDALVGNNGQDRLHLNDGSGTFTDSSAQLPPSLDITYAVALADVEGDGDLDAVLGNWNPPNRLFLNDGTGVFADATSQLPSLPGPMLAIAPGDVDADGDLDLMLGILGISFLPIPDRLFVNDGTGTFADAPSQLPPAFDNTQALTLGDVDGDGDLDALLGNLGAPDRLLLNDGSGTFADATAQIPAIVDPTWDVALGDVDGDGDLDAVMGNLGAVDRLAVNDGSGTFADASAQLPAILDATTSIALGDVDGDGDLDAVTGNHDTASGPQQARLSLNDGSGFFTDVTAQVPADLDSTVSVAFGDVDGDGDFDAWIGNSGIGTESQDRLYLNGGTGLLVDATSQIPPLLDNSRDVALGDVDGDGDLDALVGNILGPDSLRLNDGAGVFSDATSQLPAFVDDTQAVALGDVDGDGDLDAWIGNSGVGPFVRLHLNSGSGTFTDATGQVPASTGSTLEIALGDLDGDGDLDAWIGKGGTGPGTQERLFLNDGSGVFSDATAQVPSVLDPTSSVALGDVDGDGDLDAWIGNGGSTPAARQDRLHLNDGAGVFSDATAQIPADQDPTNEVALGDVDGDGDLDVLLANSTGLGAQDRLYSNDGTGVFTDATSELPAVVDSTRTAALVDGDGDGDLDAFLGKVRQPDALLSNLTWQLAWRGIPRLGKPLTLDLFGPPGGGWSLGASFATANIPLGAVGTFRLDPAVHIHVALGPLDADGKASISFPVPAIPAFLGLSVYWQALVAPPFHFTNLEVTTLTNL